MTDPIRSTRLFLPVSLAEGVSFLVLLLIAMPLKYAANLPQAVMAVGMIHGLLFIGYVILAFTARGELGWSAKRLLWILVMSVLPTGAFFAERSVRAESRAAAADRDEARLVTA
jgi:integral membrane protein